jgi:predicted transcriptional regulator
MPKKLDSRQEHAGMTVEEHAGMTVGEHGHV